MLMPACRRLDVYVFIYINSYMCGLRVTCMYVSVPGLYLCLFLCLHNSSVTTKSKCGISRGVVYRVLDPVTVNGFL